MWPDTRVRNLNISGPAARLERPRQPEENGASLGWSWPQQMGTPPTSGANLKNTGFSSITRTRKCIYKEEQRRRS